MVDLQAQTSWDHDSTAILTRMWNEGYSCALIAAEVKRSRAAVIGKAYRLNLSRETAPLHHRPLRPVSKPLPRNVSLAPPKPEPEPEPELPSDPVAFLDLEDHHCRAVVIERGRDGLPLCCGARRLEGCSWCREHRRKFHVKWIDYKRKEAAHG
jgi:GcrA cell cycle regulator